MIKTNQELYNPIHWKNYGVPEDGFFRIFQEDCGITREEFVRCRKEAMNFCNKYIAHSNDYEGVVPFLRITRDALVTLDVMLIGFDDDIEILGPICGNIIPY